MKINYAITLKNLLRYNEAKNLIIEIIYWSYKINGVNHQETLRAKY